MARLLTSQDIREIHIKKGFISSCTGYKYRFWNEKYFDTYRKLPLPNTTLDGYGKQKSCDSSFTITRITPETQTVFPHDVPKLPVVKDIIRARKVKLRLGSNVKRIFTDYYNGYRYLYNQTIHELLTAYASTDYKSYDDSQKARYHRVLKHKMVHEKIKGRSNHFYKNKKWLKQIPKTIRSEAYRNAVSNLQSCFTNLKNGNIRHFTRPYLIRKAPDWTLKFEKNAVSLHDDGLHIFEKTIGRVATYEQVLFTQPSGVKKKKTFVPDGGCQIQRDAVGDYWFIYPIKSRLNNVKQDKRPSVAIDPGVRKFGVAYDTNGSVTMFGSRSDNDRKWRDIKQLDDINSRLENAKGARLKKLYDLKLRLLRTTRRRRDDMHHKISTEIARKYGCVLIGDLDTGKLVSTDTRYAELRAKTKREMLGGAHGLFRKRLEEKCVAYGSVFLKVQEHYTSQTCGECGHLDKDASETHVCSSCGVRVDRDVNGARNIMLRHLGVS